ncbi:MAG: radical SAM protein [Clostridiales bacterium]|jgi:oxygen-independent coproporphyrinogen-3 oxidase|nr:radical SAM protein [Clostridiales bacterium]
MEHFEYPQLDKFQNASYIQPIEEFFKTDPQLLSPSSALYVHIPFCPRFCAFCNFYKVIYKNDGTANDYVDCLCREVDYYADRLPDNYLNLEGIHLGGGSPSCLDSALIKQLVDKIRSRFNLGSDHLISMECHVDNLQDADYIKRLADIGINRLSFGVQTFIPETRKRYGLSEIDRVYRAIENIKQSGIKNFNTDLMYNFPGQTPKDVIHDFEELFCLGANCVELNAMGIMPNSNIYRQMQNDNMLLEFQSNIDTFIEMYEYIESRDDIHLVMANTISKTPQPPNVCNSFQLGGNKVNGGAILGIGASSRGFVDGYVYKNYVNIHEYMDKVKAANNGVALQRTVDMAERYARMMVMFPMFRHVMKKDIDFNYTQKGMLDKLVEQGLIYEDDEKYYLGKAMSFYSGNLSLNFVTRTQKDKMMMYMYNSMRNNLNAYNQDDMQMSKQAGLRPAPFR